MCLSYLHLLRYRILFFFPFIIPPYVLQSLFIGPLHIQVVQSGPVTLLLWKNINYIPSQIYQYYSISNLLTHWGRVTHICVGNLSIIGSDNGLSPGRRQAIIRTNAGILLIRPLGTNFSEISIEILLFSFKKMRLKVSSAKWRPFCLGLNVLTNSTLLGSPLWHVDYV